MPDDPRRPGKLLPHSQPGPRQSVDLEIRHHLEERIDQLIASGMSPAEARREAERSFGNLESVERELHAIASASAVGAIVSRWIETLGQDLSYAARVMRRSRGFSALAILTLALGIGANTALFTVVDTVLLRPLGIPDADRVVQVRERDADSGPERYMSVPNFYDYVEGADAFLKMAPLHNTFSFQETPTGVDTVHILVTTESLLPVLGVQPMMGRGLTAEDEKPDASPVAVISHAFWVERFGADPDVVGRTLRVRADPWVDQPERTVVGVLPPDFVLPPVLDPMRWQSRYSFGFADPVGLGAPVAPDMLTPPPATWRSATNRRARTIYTVLGRLESGASLEQATAALDATAAGITATGEAAPESLQVTPLPDLLRGTYGRAFYLLWGGCVLVLLVACVNLASLLLAGGLTREREMAVRASLGASRRRLFRQLAAEAAVLGMMGGVAAIPVAFGVTVGLVALFPGDVYRIGTAVLDVRALGFLTLASVLVSVAFGIVPARRGADVDGRGRLGAWLRHGPRSRFGLLRALVVCEIALTLALVASGGLLLRTYVNLTSTDVGFDPQGVVLFWIDGRPGALSKYNGEGQDFLRQQLRDRVGSLPDVISVSEGMPPLSGLAAMWPFTIADRPAPSADERVSFDTRRAGPEYFTTLGIPLLEGRYLDEGDEERTLSTWGAWRELSQRTELSKADLMLPAVVNESLAQRFWPGESALGKGVYWGAVEGGDDSHGASPSPVEWDRRNPPFTVVGVVADVKTVTLDQEPEPTFYSGGWGHSYLARVRGDPRDAVEAIRQEVQSFDPELTLGDALPMEERIADIAAAERFRMLVIASAAVMALLLAAVGLSAVVAHSVNQRRHEIGVRISLGARRSEVSSLIGRRVVRLVSAGAVIGLALAIGLSRLLQSFLYGVEAMDPLSLAGSVLVLGSVCLLASYVPARRAAQVDPMEVLGAE